MRTIDTFKIGENDSFTKTVTEADVVMFAGITGDLNPVHLDNESAKKSVFGKRIAHGILSAGFISAVLGTKIPGVGSIYLGQELKFVKPVYIGDTITATATVTEIDVEKNRLKLDTTVTNQDGEVVVTGSALTMPPKAE